MADELKFPVNGVKADRDSLDESTASLIREMYAPAGGDGYWTGLEQRIMARVASDAPLDTRWWNVLAPWARPALIAAVTIFAIAGVFNQQLVEAEDQIAYETVLQPEIVSTSEEIISVQRGTDGATLSYFLSH